MSSLTLLFKRREKQKCVLIYCEILSKWKDVLVVGSSCVFRKSSPVRRQPQTTELLKHDLEAEMFVLGYDPTGNTCWIP